jgi:hypothetical protein
MFGNKRAELHEWAWANVGDYFGSRHRAEPTAMFNCHAAREAIQETRCVLVSCTRCVDNALYWLWFDVHQVVTVDDNRAALVASDSTKFAIVAQLL